jgi:hypothetical protein
LDLRKRSGRLDGENFMTKGFIILYSAQNIVMEIKLRRMKWAEHVARMRETRSACTIFVGQTETKNSFGRPKRRKHVNIKYILYKSGVKLWIGLN